MEGLRILIYFVYYICCNELILRTFYILLCIKSSTCIRLKDCIIHNDIISVIVISISLMPLSKDLLLIEGLKNKCRIWQLWANSSPAACHTIIGKRCRCDVILIVMLRNVFRKMLGTYFLFIEWYKKPYTKTRRNVDLIVYISYSISIDYLRIYARKNKLTIS